MTRARSKCYRSVNNRYCGATWEEHDPITRACPDGTGPGHVFYSHYQPKRAGQSFSDDEVLILAEVLEGVTRHRDMRVLARTPAFGTVATKVVRMRRRLADRKNDSAEQPAAQAAANQQQEGT